MYDLAIAAPGSSEAQPDSGGVFLFMGPATLATYVLANRVYRRFGRTPLHPDPR